MNSVPSNAVAPRQSSAVAKPTKTVKGWLESPEFRSQVARALPKHLTPDRFLRVALTAMLRTPKLLNCSPESVTQCLLQCSQFGLEPDGRRAHLIPFENRKDKTTVCTLILDYKGLVELAMRSGLVSYLHADVVREGDLFRYSLGQIETHVPWFLRRDDEKPATPGEDFAVYALARMKDGASAVAVMSIDEVYSIRDSSQGWKAFKAGYTSQCPWDPQNWVSEQEMKKKTALRRLTKMLPLSPEFRDAIDADDEEPMKPAQVDSVISRPVFGNAEPKPKLTESAGDSASVSGGESDSEHTASSPTAEPKAAAPASPAPQADQAPAPKSPQEQLADIVTGAGFTFDDFASYCAAAGFGINDAPGFEEVPLVRAKQMVKAAGSLIAALKDRKDGAQ